MTAPSTAIDRFHAVIPAGGVGSRLWPLSRAAAPKFLHSLSGSGESLLRDTWQRVAPISGEGRIMVVTGRAHGDAVREQIPELAEANLVLEEEPRDSSAAIGLAAAILVRREPEVIIGSFHADHIVRGVASFGQAVRQAIDAADRGYVVTIGVTPTEPATGFGYIRATGPAPGAPSALLADSFTEKPDLDAALSYLRSGDYLWNAGMFVARADTLLEEMRRSRPQLVAGLEELASAWDGDGRADAVARLWPHLEKIAIDYTVAEPAAAAGRFAVVPGRFTWFDVGDFATIARLGAAGRPNQLVTLGDVEKVLADDASGLVINSSGRVVAVVGLDDVVVVDTPDALLVTRTEHAQRVKQVVDRLKSTRPEVL
ncbi:MAG: mannose-1-phosphate guanylyltransferase [Micrococcales bacterium]|nr:mannose-1-phosphate guanylyltransferase [Micrococcales bacterium]